ncbi:flagellar hook-associated protein FlgK [Methylophilus sp. 3sh_L]|jgi:flagellar hook-associated protein 1 FlgK|uniref:flagellar hook-associated protein FlgK n=1 Tax=Methylophilus sp. 3sh_L TaxID=3377114 RepID=UPI00398F5769
MNVLNVGKSALTVAQLGIATTGHNIANASTPGYNRQSIVQKAAAAQSFGNGYLGQGAEVGTIVRSYDDVLAKQVINTTSNQSSSSVYLQGINEVNSLLSDDKAGVSAVMTEFFRSVSAAAANPSDIATRQTVISNAQSLVSRFTAVNSRLDEMRSNINTQVSTSVATINSYASSIADLNEKIKQAFSSTGNPPNDLMDQRDLLVTKISEQIKTTVLPQSDNTYNVSIGNGIPIVLGNQSQDLYAVPNDTDSSRLEVGYGASGSPKPISGSLTGGALGGALQFRDETLDTVQNQLGQLAITFATAFNNQHKQGTDLTGAVGQNLFNIAGPVAISNRNNTDQSKQASVAITDPSLLTSSNYTLEYVNGQYNITRQNDKYVWSNVTLPFNQDGITINTNTSSPTNGDSYLIKPTQYAASGLTLAVTDVEKLALADNPSKGESDNTNALKLANLQNQNFVRVNASSTNRTFAQAYALTTSAVGIKANQMSIMNQADKTALDDATSAMQSQSGVNLDEEAANLLRYQQAYQAAGKMMQIASNMFDTLLSLGK